MGTQIKTMFDSVPNVRKDWKEDWKEDAKADWKIDWDSIPGVPPVNSVLPAITGVAQDTQVLTVSNGTWVGALSFAYQWKVGGVIAGTNADTYTCVTADIGATVSCTVTATNANGQAAATAVSVGPVIA